MNYIHLFLTLLSLGLAIFAIYRTNVLRKELRMPVVKKFNPNFKKKPVDIPRADSFQKNNQNDKNQQNNRQQNQQNRNKNQNRNNQMSRRPVNKVPEVFSNENASSQSEQPAAAPPRPTDFNEQPVVEGRRPLPQRANVAAAEPAVVASPAPQNSQPHEDEEFVSFDRTKMNHGRRVTAQKPMIEDEEAV